MLYHRDLLGKSQDRICSIIDEKISNYYHWSILTVLNIGDTIRIGFR